MGKAESKRTLWLRAAATRTAVHTNCGFTLVYNGMGLAGIENYRIGWFYPVGPPVVKNTVGTV